MSSHQWRSNHISGVALRRLRERKERRQELEFTSAAQVASLMSSNGPQIDQCNICTRHNEIAQIRADGTRICIDCVDTI